MRLGGPSGVIPGTSPLPKIRNPSGLKGNDMGWDGKIASIELAMCCLKNPPKFENFLIFM